MHFFSATRAHGLARLATFTAAGGDQYLTDCDTDYGPQRRAHEVLLTPYLRHRLVTTEEVVRAVRAQFESTVASAFVEQLWRQCYAAGWLAHHPVVYQRFLSDLLSLDADIDNHAALRRRYDTAGAGATGVACFDAWIHEAAVGGYLHHHAQCAFASIWLFTLELPWQLGVRFFMRHLLDAELAQALLLWRRVAGLEDRAPYLVSSEELEQLTARRFPRAVGLAQSAPEIALEPPYAASPMALETAQGGAGPVVLLVTCDDLHPESWPLGAADVTGILLIEPFDLYDWHGDPVLSFKLAGLDDAARRAGAHFDCPTMRLPRSELRPATALKRNDNRQPRDWFDTLKGDRLVAMMPAAGPVQDDIAAACQRLSHGDRPPQLAFIQRPWDDAFLSAAGDGEAAFMARIPSALAELELDIWR